MYMRGLDSRTNRDVAVIIPSTGRAEQCARLVDRIYETARTWPHVTISIEPDDVKPYARALTAGRDERQQRYTECGAMVGLAWDQTGLAGPGSHVAAINRAAACHTERSYCPNDTNGDGDCAQCAHNPTAHSPKLIIKMDDDHWPVTDGWDREYLAALDRLGGTGVVYGDDLHQFDRLATVPGLSTDIVRELGWYAPPQLGHLYVDNFWHRLGHASGLVEYLPDVIIEHRHPSAVLGIRTDATYEAGGMSPARWKADEATWNDMIRVPVGGETGRMFFTNPSQMDLWVESVRALAERAKS